MRKTLEILGFTVLIYAALCMGCAGTQWQGSGDYTGAPGLQVRWGTEVYVGLAGTINAEGGAEGEVEEGAE